MDDITLCGEGEYELQYHAQAIGWIVFTVILLVLLLYFFMAVIVRRRNVEWPTVRIIHFFTGSMLVLVFFAPPLMERGHDSFQAHMLQHLLSGMFAPVFLVMGAPVTLALKTVPPKIARMVVKLLQCKAVENISHPLAALLLNTGALFLLYLTPLYSISLSNSFLHYIIHIHFVLAGYLFVWSLIGVDPVKFKSCFQTKVCVLLIGMALHSFLSKLMYAHHYPLNTPFTADDIQRAAKSMYYWGDLAEGIVLVILFYFEYQMRPSVRQQALSSATRSVAD